jgi:hypothetical protein
MRFVTRGSGKRKNNSHVDGIASRNHSPIPLRKPSLSAEMSYKDEVRSGPPRVLGRFWNWTHISDDPSVQFGDEHTEHRPCDEEARVEDNHECLSTSQPGMVKRVNESARAAAPWFRWLSPTDLGMMIIRIALSCLRKVLLTPIFAPGGRGRKCWTCFANVVAGTGRIVTCQASRERAHVSRSPSYAHSEPSRTSDSDRTSLTTDIPLTLCP